MLQNACFLAKIGADAAENEQHFSKICRDRDADAEIATLMLTLLKSGSRRRVRHGPPRRQPPVAGGGAISYDGRIRGS